jgi:glutathione S-transferase
LHDRVASRPRLADYLASARRLPFNQGDLLRHYPELDG